MASTVLGKRGSPVGDLHALDTRPFKLAKYHHEAYESLVKHSKLVFEHKMTSALRKRGAPVGEFDTLDTRSLKVAKYHHKDYESLVKRSNLVPYIQNPKVLESPHDIFFSGIRYGRELLQEQV